MLSTTAATRSVRESFRDVLGSRAGCKTYAAMHRAGLSDLAKRARAFDRIERAARAEGLNGNDVAAIVYSEVEKTTGRKVV
jgi:hypothetical protein